MTELEALKARIRVKIRDAIARASIRERKVNCSFCTEPAVSAFARRVGEVPAGWDLEPKKYPDKSHLVVVRVCEQHKRHLLGTNLS